MKLGQWIRVMLILLVAVLLPLEQVHCALLPLRAMAALQVDHHDADGDHCCDETSPEPTPVSPVDSPCSCPCIQLPAATAPVSIELPLPASISTSLAASPMPALAIHVGGVYGGLAPEARSGSPPGLSSSPQSPRGPPNSA